LLYVRQQNLSPELGLCHSSVTARQFCNKSDYSLVEWMYPVFGLKFLQLKKLMHAQAHTRNYLLVLWRLLMCWESPADEIWQVISFGNLEWFPVPRRGSQQAW